MCCRSLLGAVDGWCSTAFFHQRRRQSRRAYRTHAPLPLQHCLPPRCRCLPPRTAMHTPCLYAHRCTLTRALPAHTCTPRLPHHCHNTCRLPVVPTPHTHLRFWLLFANPSCVSVDGALTGDSIGFMPRFLTLCDGSVIDSAISQLLRITTW